MPRAQIPAIALLFLTLASSALAAPGGCRVVRAGCRASAKWTARACEENCTRLGDASAVATCRTDCRSARTGATAACNEIAAPCIAACGSDDATCTASSRTCHRDARRAHLACRRGCDGAGDLRCQMACERARGVAEAACGYVVAGVEPGAGTVPSLPTGEPANLSLLLDDAEQAVVAAADARAATLRSRPLRLWVGKPGAEVTVTQTKHGFAFGFPIDLREFVNDPEGLAFYESLALDHTNFVVAETSMKWRTFETTEGNFGLPLADQEMAWAAGLGFPVKGHTLLWGNVPPLSSGSGVPVWIRERYPNASLTPAQQEELRGSMKRYVDTVVGRFRGRIDTWDVTNETLNLFTPFFMDRLGPSIVNDIFDWAYAIDPGVTFVFNEWITEVFTGLPGPNAAAVRDRVRGLLAEGAKIDAIGQQAHFVPGIVYAGGTADLSQRTRIDAYAVALDTLAEVGLPLHMTEVNFVAPDVPELRAAQAEALMRLWWGHPQVEQIVFWGLWNEVNARNYLHHGLWDNDGTLTRHGAAVVSLLNDRWRTRATLTADGSGAVELRATHGDYVASWVEDGQPVHVEFRVERGPGTAVVAVAR